MKTLFLQNPSNISAVYIDDLDGLKIDPSDQISITDLNLNDLANSEDLVLKLLEGSVELNDGISDYQANDAVNIIKGLDITPKTPDGKIITVTSNRPIDSLAYYTSNGDDMQNGIVGEGEALVFEIDPLSTQSKTIFFLEEISFESGTINAYNDPTYGRVDIGSYVTFEIIAPAGIPYPNYTGTGTLDFDGTNFIPNTDGTGTFDINMDADTVVNRFVNKVLISQGDTIFTTPEPGKVPVSYGCRFTIYNASTTDKLDASISMMMYRKQTY